MAYEFRCNEIGAVCRCHYTASTKDDVLEQVTACLRSRHNVALMSKTLQRFVLRHVKAV